MLFSQATFLLALAGSLVSARPYYKRWDGDATPDSWPGAKSSSTNSRAGWAASTLAGPTAPDTCDMSNAQMPSNAAAPLPAVDAGLSLFHVAIGRGTQNYTCDTANATAVPVPIGAVATLYNVSCLAARDSGLLASLPMLALQLPAAPALLALPFAADISGHHYFLNPTTPYFNLDTDAHQYGAEPVSKAASESAPTNAMKGQFGQGDGAVAWLMLNAQDPATAPFQQVFRVNTQGGNPPATCQGQQAAFEVQYAAEYWFYA